MSSASISHYAGVPYLRIDKLSPEDQAHFTAWVLRQTRLIIPSELDANGRPAPCTYAWDYAAWLAIAKSASVADPYAT